MAATINWGTKFGPLQRDGLTSEVFRYIAFYNTMVMKLEPR